MKSKLFLLPITLLLVCNLQAQRTDTVKPYYQDTTRWEYKMETSGEKWGRLTKRTDFQLFNRNVSKETMKKGVKGNIGYYGEGRLYWLNDIDEVELAAAGVTKQNAGDYIYHVVMNDSIEIVPWTKPVEFRTNNKITYAYLGKFNVKNKILRLEMYNLKHYYDRIIYTFNDLYLPKAQLKNVVLNYNNKYLFRPYQQHFIPGNRQHYYSEKQWMQENTLPAKSDSSKHDAGRYKPVFSKLKKGDISFPWSDSINHFAIEIERTIQNDMYNVYLKRTVNGKTDTVYVSNDWSLSYYSPDPKLRINSSYFNKPGEYEMIIVPEAPDEFNINTFDKALSIPFTILPSQTKAFTSAQVAFFISALLLIFGVVFIMYHLIHKRLLAREAQQKEIALLQLQSVRSQLNPHFMFNALAGIQNLMNKNDVNAANLYLNKFARLTRHVLDDSKKDMVGIEEERNLLETYLQMEQLRFGFKYDIFVDEKIDQANTEIPAMLIQPFVENAVKHGVSPFNGNGRVNISFIQDEGSLHISIKDNGNGFTEENSVKGNGTRLSQERIDWLNRLHKETHISLRKKSGHTGTVISLQLNGYSHALNGH